MDELKKYLQQHEPQMDFDEPGPLVWEKIIEPDTKKRSPILKIMFRISAAAAIVTGLFFGAEFLLTKKNTAIVPIAVNTEMPAKADTFKSDVAIGTGKDSLPAPAPVITAKEKKQDARFELMNSFEKNYSQLVNYQLKNIRSTPVYAESADYFNDFKTRLQQMDADERAIRSNIHRHGMSNSLLEQLINVYQQKLDVLKSLQQEINKMNTRVHENVPADSLNTFYLNI